MTEGPDRLTLANAPLATLTARPASEAALGVCLDVCADTVTPRTGKKPSRLQVQACQALIADLLDGDAARHDGWRGRQLTAATFTGGDIGYHVFRTVFDALKDAGLMEVRTGKRDWRSSEFTNNEWAQIRGMATRFRATEALRGRFASAGITWETWGDHFHRKPPQRLVKLPSVELRAAKLRQGRENARGASIRFSVRKDPVAAAIVKRMDRLNAFLAAQTIEPFGPVRLRRIFNDGNAPDFNWTSGGRLTAPGADSYQTAKKEDRRAMTINGQAVTEIDIRASHLTIMVGLGHLPASVLEGDPYSIDGLPRPVVKQWVTMTLGHGRRHRAWSAEAIKSLAKEGLDARAEYPLRTIVPMILERLPILQGDEMTVPVGWGELQYLESETLLRAMEVLAYEDGVASLPVHDSLIVEAESVELAKVRLKEAFKATVGVEPTLSE